MLSALMQYIKCTNRFSQIKSVVTTHAHSVSSVKVWKTSSLAVPSLFIELCIPLNVGATAPSLPSKCLLGLFLAHLSRRLMGELIVYQSLWRPSSVRPSTISNIFSSETTGPINFKLHMETP